MKAIVQPRYGSPDVLQLRDVDQPTVGDDQVLVRVHAAAVNIGDWHLLRGVPYVIRLVAGLQRPKRYTKDWEHDPAFAASTAESFQSPYVRTLTSELWLPGTAEFAFTAPDMSGTVVQISFASELQRALRELNERTWQANLSDIAVWRRNGPVDVPDLLELRAQFGFAVLFTLANLAIENRLPMKLDY